MLTQDQRYAGIAEDSLDMAFVAGHKTDPVGLPESS
jgi:hypothetical protein